MLEVSLLRDATPGLILPCADCGKPALGLSLDGDTLIIYGNLQAYGFKPYHPERLFKFAKEGAYYLLHAFMSEFYEQRLEGFCTTCQTFYCGDCADIQLESEQGHWGEGMYMICPREHSTIIR
jgi:hypothetical protein